MHELPAQSLSAITSQTRTDVAIAQMARAVDRMERLARDTESAFAEYLNAQAACRTEGVTIELELNPGMAAHLSHYKQTCAAAKGRALAQADAS